jgi:predicted secreted Zn-dependent protease
MKHMLAGGIAILATTLVADAASVSRSYSYFSIGGQTLSEIETELQRRGPLLGSTGNRHPGATRMEFKTRIGYQEDGRRCSVSEADVRISAEVHLPRWRNRRGAQIDTALMWDTLSADIRRHEEGHIVIARTYAQRMEEALLGVRNASSCQEAAAAAEGISKRLLTEHDAEQARYDNVESINFESRMLRLLEYRLEKIEDGRQP